MENNIHPLSDVKSFSIGKNTRVWQYSVILHGAQIGDFCNINCHTFIESDVVVGDNVTIKSGTYIWDGVRVEDDVFIGPCVVFTNDVRPRSKQRVDYPKTTIKKGASLGANSTILAGITIGEYAMTGIGSVVTRDVPPYALVYGNPARIRGWVDKKGKKLKEINENVWVNDEGDKFTLKNNMLTRL